MSLLRELYKWVVGNKIIHEPHNNTFDLNRTSQEYKNQFSNAACNCSQKKKQRQPVKHQGFREPEYQLERALICVSLFQPEQFYFGHCCTKFTEQPFLLHPRFE